MQKICPGVREEKCYLIALDAEVLSYTWGKEHLCGSELGAEGLRGTGITHSFCFTKSHPGMEQ